METSVAVQSSAADVSSTRCKACGSCCSSPERCSHCGYCSNCGFYTADPLPVFQVPPMRIPASVPNVWPQTPNTWPTVIVTNEN